MRPCSPAGAVPWRESAPSTRSRIGDSSPSPRCWGPPGPARWARRSPGRTPRRAARPRARGLRIHLHLRFRASPWCRRRRRPDPWCRAGPATRPSAPGAATAPPWAGAPPRPTGWRPAAERPAAGSDAAGRAAVLAVAWSRSPWSRRPPWPWSPPMVPPDWPPRRPPARRASAGVARDKWKSEGRAAWSRRASSFLGFSPPPRKGRAALVIVPIQVTESKSGPWELCPAVSEGSPPTGRSAPASWRRS